MHGGARTVDLDDGTTDDIALASEEFRRLIITHRNNELMSVALVNLLELVLQSARTRVCIINLAKLDSTLCRAGDVKKAISFHSFRYNSYFDRYCDELAAKKNNLIAWLTEHCFVLRPNQGDSLAICLVRVQPPHGLQYEFIAELEESYDRLAVFFKPIVQEASFLQAFCDAFQPSLNSKKQSELNTDLHCQIPSKVTDNIWNYDAKLAALYACADEIYKEFHHIPLVQVSIPNEVADSAPVNYSNLFFFVRLNASLHASVNSQGTQDGFMVKLVLPKTQQQHLSQFFHEQREGKCPWFKAPSKCQVKHIKQCVLASKWAGLSKSVTDQEQIHAHYQSLWKELASLIVSKPRLAGAAFRTKTIVFERRSLSSPEKDDTQMFSKDKADKIMSCIKSRLIQAPQQKEIVISLAASKEDYVPQLMLIPIYHYDTPIVAIGTVANARRHSSLKVPNEWQRTFQFANFVYRSVAYRFKARMQEAYLELISQSVKEIYQSLSPSVAAYGGRLERQGYFIEAVNNELEDLSRIYAYPKFSLHLLDDSVINKDIHKCLVVDDFDDLAIAVDPLGYWQKPVEKQWFTEQKVFKAFQKAVHEVIVEKTLDQIKRAREHILRGQGLN